MRAASLTPRCQAAAHTAVRRVPTVRASAAPAAATASAKIADAAKATVQGTSRKVNEDRAVLEPTGTSSAFSTYAAVFDGHGGSATADWLVANLAKIIDKNWDGAAPEKSVTAAFLAADRRLLAPGGLLGMGERGVGGSKCGSTAAVAGIVSGGAASPPTLLAAGVGDARVLLIRGEAVTQLTVDHVPDADEERERIERTNPNPKMPLVRWVGGTWRAGGILALSRAFGDAYMKGSLQFEGISAGSDGYSSGFGVIAQPDITLTALAPVEDAWVLCASDGLFANVERGGGGGLSNEEVAGIVAKVGGSGAAAVGAALTAAAQAAGSTDDVTVVALRVVV